MAATDKIETLRRIEHEDKFRETVLMPLFDKMGLSPVHTHGSNERGKDIVCYETNAFGLTEWIAIIAKVGKITGSTYSVGGFQTVLNQVEEAFGYPYKDPRSKRDVSINKAIVVTNDEILVTAREKIVDKLGVPSAKHANVHFLGAEPLSKLIDESWSDFWRVSADLLADEDRMTEDAGLVLYVLARAHTQSQAGFKKKVESALTTDKVRRQTGLAKSQVDSALKYLLQTDYVEGTKKTLYRLHRRQTLGYLLVDPNQIRLLFAIKGIADDDGRFTLGGIIEESKQDVLSFAQAFVSKTISELEHGGYIKKDDSRGKGHWVLDMDMVDEERPYLERQLKLLSRLPAQRR